MDLGGKALLQLNDGDVDKDWSIEYNEDGDYCWIKNHLMIIPNDYNSI